MTPHTVLVFSVFTFIAGISLGAIALHSIRDSYLQSKIDAAKVEAGEREKEITRLRAQVALHINRVCPVCHRHAVDLANLRNAA